MMRRGCWVVGVLALLVTACRPAGTPHVAPIAASAFPALRDQVVDALLADDPARARELGLHEYDGRVPDVSGAAIERRIVRLRRDAAQLAAVESHSLSPDDALDLAELKSWVGQDLFWLDDMEAAKRRPQFYEPLFLVDRYLDRDYAPIDVRAKSLVLHEGQALVQLGNVEHNLAVTLPGPVARAAAREFAGLASFYRDDVAKQVGGVGDATARERFARVNGALAARLEQFAGRLERAASDADTSHVLGPERYAKLLLVQEGLTMPIDELSRRNEADLERNRRAFAPFAGHVRDPRIAEPDLLGVAEATTDATRRFVVDKSIVTIPFDEKIVVKPSPPFLQWSGAFFDGAGPFDTVRGSHYFITLPDASLPPAERAARIVPLAQLHNTTVHEVYPGHFLQSLWVVRAPTKVQKMYQSYSFTEGWAHYAEEMMVEQGYGADVSAMKPAMLIGALARNCRVAASIGLHTRGETVEEAAKRFVEVCAMSRPAAEREAIRGTFDPGYFAYTLGKMQILALRGEAQKRLGDRFSLQKFHDALLAHGSAPVALIRDRVLADLGAAP